MAEGTGVVPVQLTLLGKNRYGSTNVDNPILLDFDRAYGGFRQQGAEPPGTSSPPPLHPAP